MEPGGAEGARRATPWAADANSRGSAARLLEEAEGEAMQLPDYVML